MKPTRCPDRSKEAKRVEDALRWLLDDVTDTEELRRRLEDAHRSLQDIIEASPAGFIAFDAIWRVTMFNPAAERIIGRPAGEVLGRHILEAFPHLRGGPFERIGIEAVTEGRPISFEERDATTGQWVGGVVFPYPDGQCAFFEDRTKAKRAEEAQERIQATQAAVASAEENFRLAQGRFDAGVGTIIELTDAQLALTQAQNTEAQALSDMRIALYRLDRALGRR